MGLQIRRAWTDGFSELDVALGKPGQEAQISRRVEEHLSGGPRGQGLVAWSWWDLNKLESADAMLGPQGELTVEQPCASVAWRAEHGQTSALARLLTACQTTKAWHGRSRCPVCPSFQVSGPLPYWAKAR